MKNKGRSEVMSSDGESIDDGDRNANAVATVGKTEGKKGEE